MLTEKLLRQQSWRLLLTVRAKLPVPMAGHERKHDACRAEIGDAVKGEEVACNMTSTERMHCNGADPWQVPKASRYSCTKIHRNELPVSQIHVTCIWLGCRIKEEQGGMTDITQNLA